VNNILYEFFQKKQVFWYWANSCCNYRIPEVPIEIFPIQPVLEALEGSGKARGAVSSEGRSHPWNVQVVGKRVGGLELAMVIDR
jgi:hypothetical protein